MANGPVIFLQLMMLMVLMLMVVSDDGPVRSKTATRNRSDVTTGDVRSTDFRVHDIYRLTTKRR